MVSIVEEEVCEAVNNEWSEFLNREWDKSINKVVSAMQSGDQVYLYIEITSPSLQKIEIKLLDIDKAKFSYDIPDDSIFGKVILKSNTSKDRLDRMNIADRFDVEDNESFIQKFKCEAEEAEEEEEENDEEPIEKPVKKPKEKPEPEEETISKFFCPKCNTEVTKEDTKCSGCGAVFIGDDEEIPEPEKIEVDEEEEDAFYCPKCEAEVFEDYIKCPKCGADFFDDEEEDDEEPISLCPKCKTKVTEGDAKCPGCGAVFIGEGEESLPSKGEKKRQVKREDIKRLVNESWEEISEAIEEEDRKRKEKFKRMRVEETEGATMQEQSMDGGEKEGGETLPETKRDVNKMAERMVKGFFDSNDSVEEGSDAGEGETSESEIMFEEEMETIVSKMIEEAEKLVEEKKRESPDVNHLPQLDEKRSIKAKKKEDKR